MIPISSNFLSSLTTLFMSVLVYREISLGLSGSSGYSKKRASVLYSAVDENRFSIIYGRSFPRITLPDGAIACKTRDQLLSYGWMPDLSTPQVSRSDTGRGLWSPAGPYSGVTIPVSTRI